MTLLNDTKFNNGVKLFTMMAVMAMISISFGCYHGNFLGFLGFVLFFVAYVQLPGLFLLRVLGTRFNHFSTTMVIGIFAGWSMEIAVYFITEVIHTNILMYAAGPILTILYIIALVRARAAKDKTGADTGSANGAGITAGCSRFRLSFSNVSTAFCVFIVLALLYSLLNTQYIYLAPEVSSMTYMNPDKGYHLGLINSLSAGWPLESPWVQGRVIHYHIFTEMLYSIPLRLFGIPSDVLLLTCGPYMTIYVFSLSLYALFKEFTSNHKRTGLYCLALMLSNIFIAKGLNRSLAFFFVFRNENATAYGISCFMAVLIIVKYWFEKYQAKEKSWNFFLLVLPLVMLVTGLKGPMGLVIIAAIWGTYVLGIILRKVPLRTILPILIVTAGFLIIYVFILGSKGQTNGGGNSIFALATIVDVCFYKSSVVALLKGFGLPTIVRLAVLLVIFMIFTLTAFIIPFTVGYIREFVLVVLGKKEFGFAQVMVYAACLAGFAAMFIMNYSGHSQVYFGYAAVFMAPLVSFRFFEDMEGNRDLLMSLVRGIFIGMLILTSCTLFSYYKDNVAEAEITLNDATDENRYECVSNDEYDAMVWIRENTPQDSLLATDRFYSEPLDQYSYTDRWTNRFFLYADYSNRFCYIAGSGYNLPADGWVIRMQMITTNSKLYDVNNADRGDLARELGVDYVVVSKQFTKVGDLSNEDYKLCYSNPDVDVYEVVDNK